MIMTDATLLEKKFWQLLKSQNATSFGGVPYTYEMLRKLRFDRMELPSLRYITQAGGNWQKRCAPFRICLQGENIKFIVMYGQTEATANVLSSMGVC